MNSQIIRNFDDFLNEEEEFDLYEENDFLDEIDEIDELDESYEDDFDMYSEEDDYDFDSEYEEELDESEDYEDFEYLEEGLGKMLKNMKDKAAPLKMKYKAALAPKLIMTGGVPGKLNAVLNAPVPANLGYTGFKNRDMVASVTIDYLRMASRCYPGKLDKAAFKKIMDNLFAIHKASVAKGGGQKGKGPDGLGKGKKPIPGKK